MRTRENAEPIATARTVDAASPELARGAPTSSWTSEALDELNERIWGMTSSARPEAP